MVQSNHDHDDTDLHSLLEDAIDFAIYKVTIDPESPYGGRVDMVSQSIKDIVGIENPYLFETWFENIHPDDLERITAANQRSWAKGVRYDESARFFNERKGHWVWVRTISTPVFRSDGKLTHFHGLILDISQQKQTVAELEHHNALENLILSLSTRFIRYPSLEIDTAIAEALCAIGEFTAVDRAYVFAYSDDQQMMSCTHEWCRSGIEPQIQNLKEIPVEALPWSNQILLNGDLLHIPSVANLPDIARNEKIEFEDQGIKSLLAVPMIFQGKVTGLLGFDSVRSEKSWDADSSNLLQVVGSIIVNAQENKMAQESLRKAHDELELRVIERTEELKRANDNLRTEIEQRKRAENLLQISQALYSEVFEQTPLQIFVVEVLPDNHFRVLRTNPAHQRGSGLLPDQIWGKTIEELVIPEVATAINQHYIDCLNARQPIEYEEQGPSPYWNVERIRTFRTTIAPVFDQQGNVIRLIGSSEDITEQKKAETIILERAREQAIAAERGRLARDLHDAVTQTLFSTTLTAEVLPKIWEKNPEAGQTKLAELRELTRGALAEMRTLLLELRPDTLADSKLEDLLSHLTNAFIARARVPIQLVMNGDCTLPLNVKIAFYRIAQEALNNIVKHADPDLISISLTCQSTHIELAIADDGQGFDPDQMTGTDHHGLRIMRERAEEVGASLVINSQINQGTSILLKWSEDGASENNPPNEEHND